jgi:hypothetical protein
MAKSKATPRDYDKQQFVSATEAAEIIGVSRAQIHLYEEGGLLTNVSGDGPDTRPDGERYQSLYLRSQVVNFVRPRRGRQPGQRIPWGKGKKKVTST